MKNKKFTILYVDDEEANLRVFKAVFAREFQVLTTLNPEHGLDLLARETIDLIIADQRMPKMTGVAFLKQAMEIKAEVPRILLTGFTDMTVIRSAINEAGIYKYLSKPWHKTEMLDIIHKALELYQVKREKQQLFQDLENALDLVRAQEERLQMAIDAADQGLWDWKIDTKELYISPECYKMLGYQPFEFEPKLAVWQSKIHKDDWEDAKEMIQLYMDGRQELLECDLRIRDKDNFWRWINIHGKIVQHNSKGKPERMMGILMDVTDKRKAQDRIISTIVQTEDKERKRVAKELHDSLGQSLTTALLNFNYVKSGGVQMDESLQSKFQIGLDFLNHSIKESRNISHNLHPKSITDYGFVSAVEGMLIGLNGVTKTEFHFHHNLKNRRLNNALEIGMYRITQEAVHNILKYANADSATIQLMCFPEEVCLSIEDNGVGFPPVKLKERNGSLGITSMENRVKALQGRFHIDTQVGKGTSIFAQLPYEQTQP